jgi:hypothetical protein
MPQEQMHVAGYQLPLPEKTVAELGLWAALLPIPVYNLAVISQAPSTLTLSLHVVV